MSEIHYCKNCKHLGLDGMFGLICDVNGNNENHDCPKYEEKGEGMTEPDYYSKNGLSPLTAFQMGLISRDEYIGFIKGNIIKYVIRCDKKGQTVSDIDKAMSYLTLLKKELKE